MTYLFLLSQVVVAWPPSCPLYMTVQENMDSLAMDLTLKDCQLLTGLPKTGLMMAPQVLSISQAQINYPLMVLA